MKWFLAAFIPTSGLERVATACSNILLLLTPTVSSIRLARGLTCSSLTMPRHTSVRLFQKQLATGFVHPAEGNVYAKPAALNKNGNNVYFDEANKIWKIGHQWVVAKGSFGADIDTFQVTE